MIELARIFQDGMILQRNKPIKVWGKSNDDHKIEAYIEDQLVFEGEIKKGDFEIYLKEQEASEDINILFKSDGETIYELKNTDIGEVWIAGGQSNMEFLLEYDDLADEIIPSSNDQHLRFYDVGKYTFKEERDEGLMSFKGWDKWYKLTPINAGKFSAVGYYYAQKVRNELNVPIGIVGCNYGGTSAFAWADIDEVRMSRDLVSYVDSYEEGLKNLEFEEYYKKNKEARENMASPKMVKLMSEILSGKMNPIKRKMFVLMAPLLMKKITSPITGPYDTKRPGVLFENMVLEIAGFSCRGVLWYQGESDDDNGYARVYSELFTKVIESWRKAWREEIPFLFVQLATFEHWLIVTANEYPVIREQQEKVSKELANTWMTTAIDVGKKNDIHPKRKKPVGERLAFLALDKIYGKRMASDCPVVEKVEWKGNEVVVTFKNVDKGLSVHGNPRKIKALVVYVDGKKCNAIRVNITNDSMIVASKIFTNVSEVRIDYARQNYFIPKIYNSVGFPVLPFTRTIKR